MELTTIERQLWDIFVDAVWKELQKQFDESPDDIKPYELESVIDNTVDFYAMTYIRLPHASISSNRVAEIIAGAAYLIKKKVKAKMFD